MRNVIQSIWKCKKKRKKEISSDCKWFKCNLVCLILPSCFFICDKVWPVNRVIVKIKPNKSTQRSLITLAFISFVSLLFFIFPFSQLCEQLDQSVDRVNCFTLIPLTQRLSLSLSKTTCFTNTFLTRPYISFSLSFFQSTLSEQFARRLHAGILLKFGDI